MIILVILLALALGLIYFLFNKLRKANEVIEELQNKVEFTNIIPREDYGFLSAYLKSKKSKLSAVNKTEILNMWNAILLKIPSDYTNAVKLDTKVLDNDDPLTKAEHKKALIEALDDLHDSDEINVLYLQKAVYHLYYLIYV